MRTSPIHSVCFDFPTIFDIRDKYLFVYLCQHYSKFVNLFEFLQFMSMRD
jgi:hypothetical protein